MREYDHKKIEKKWQENWERSDLYKAENSDKKPKYYLLVEFPYPSGDGLHVGHVRSYTALDIIARKKRAEGYNVLYPIGWDAFGLPTENYAIKTKISPQEVTKKNTDTFRRQLKSLGLSFDWSREINTTDPSYYKWTQWIFLRFFKKGLAYKKKMSINWCLDCKIGLANEEVIDGSCERCGGKTEKRKKEQWMLAITKYADRLYDDLDKVDYPERVKIQQRNWIGRSEGAEIEFALKNIPVEPDGKHKVKVFTTRPDTLFGATFLAVSPEMAEEWLKIGWQTGEEVKKFINDEMLAKQKRGFGVETEKRGIDAGIMAINPANKEEIPVWVVNYVLGDVGTGAIMAVPAHDERDFEFAKKFSLPIKEVISGGDTKKEAYTGEGILMNSEKFNGIKSQTAKKEITKFINGKWTTTYKLRDWVFSRQRYWGEPIPLIYCEKDGWVPVPEKDLPVLLPEVKAYTPTDNGESPLAKLKEWVETRCPKCEELAYRETDTMPNWAGSSWYYLRYLDPGNDKELATKENLERFMPIDWYNGGMEHTTLHLLYSRFWHKFLCDEGVVFEDEPYKKRTSHGLILAEGGEKMSKSKGNIVSPDEIAGTYGADTLRLYEMFMGPFEQTVSWNTDSIIGPRRFLERVWKLKEKISEKKDNKLDIYLHKTIKKVSFDMENLGFNTAVSALMIFQNEMDKTDNLSKDTFEIFLRLLAPFAPHITEEIWQELGHDSSIHAETWPKFDESKTIDASTTIVVQINGRVRDSFEIIGDTSEEEIKNTAVSRDLVKKWLSGNPPKNVIYVKGRLVNIVT